MTGIDTRAGDAPRSARGDSEKTTAVAAAVTNAPYLAATPTFAIMASGFVPLQAEIGIDMADFLTDVKTLREQAKQEIEKGPVTAAYRADVDRVIEVLNASLAK